MRMRLLAVGALLMSAGLLIHLAASPALGGPSAAAGATRVAKWQGDKQAAFLLMFDDSLPSQVQTVLPELIKRRLVATFYINPGKAEWKAKQAAWERDIPAAGMVYGNHTMTHVGARNVQHLDDELAGCNQIIQSLFPGKQPRLISYGKPGVKKGRWNVTAEEERALLAKHHLVSRPPFTGHGGAVHLKTAADMMKLVDAAINKGGVEYIIYHGVGKEWFPVAPDEFVSFLDQLVAKRDQVWITDHISAHKYQMEQSTAQVKVLEATAKRIRVALSCDADPALYDLPLTLVTQVPAGWKRCRVTQSKDQKVVPVSDGAVCYEALPDGTPILLEAVP